MSINAPILLFEPDPAVRASLKFSLELESFDVELAENGDGDPAGAGCLVIDQRFREGDGLAFLADLRGSGCTTPAILMATNPTRRLRERALAAGAVLVEKPLLGNALSQALRAILGRAEAA